MTQGSKVTEPINEKNQELIEKAKAFIVPGYSGIHKIRKKRKMERRNRKAGRKHTS